jgi:hypothetical protein
MTKSLPLSPFVCFSPYLFSSGKIPNGSRTGIRPILSLRTPTTDVKDHTYVFFVKQSQWHQRHTSYDRWHVGCLMTNRSLKTSYTGSFRTRTLLIWHIISTDSPPSWRLEQFLDTVMGSDLCVRVTGQTSWKMILEFGGDTPWNFSSSDRRVFKCILRSFGWWLKRLLLIPHWETTTNVFHDGDRKETFLTAQVWGDLISLLVLKYRCVCLFASVFIWNWIKKRQEPRANNIVVYYESIKREVKIKPIYECRCDGRL